MSTTGAPLRSPEPHADAARRTPAAPAAPPARVLWTGGWDSTFRVCMLVLVHRLPVQPYYLFVATRKGSGQELATIQRLKRLIRAKDPDAGAMILPTTVIERDELRDFDHRKAQLDALREHDLLGEQYTMLAALCDTLGLDDLELCVHRDDRAHHHLAGHTVTESSGAASRERLDPRTPVSAPIRLFENFRFPLLALDKLDMQALATKHGFADVMGETWFCHSPRNGRPCGVCNPCEYVREEGLGWRLPPSTRARAASIRLLRRARMLVSDPARAMRKIRERLRRSRS